MTFVDWTTDTGVKATAMVDVWEALNAPFDPSDIEWRPGFVSKEKRKALALAYVTSRGVQSRLDEVVGPQNWRLHQEYIAGQGFICTLAVRIDGEWVEKQDGSDFSDMEAFKGGMSGALKRAAVLWGIGRYLYELGNIWHPVKEAGKGWRLDGKPDLPPAFLPKGSKPAAKPRKSPAKAKAKKEEPQAEGAKNPMCDPLPFSMLPEALFLFKDPASTWGELIAAAEEGNDVMDWLVHMAKQAQEGAEDNCPFTRAKKAVAWLKSKPEGLEAFRAKYGTKDSGMFDDEHAA